MRFGKCNNRSMFKVQKESPPKGMTKREGFVQELYFKKGTRASQSALPR